MCLFSVWSIQIPLATYINTHKPTDCHKFNVESRHEWAPNDVFKCRRTNLLFSSNPFDIWVAGSPVCRGDHRSSVTSTRRAPLSTKKRHLQHDRTSFLHVHVLQLVARHRCETTNTCKHIPSSYHHNDKMQCVKKSTDTKRLIPMISRLKTSGIGHSDTVR